MRRAIGTLVVLLLVGGGIAAFVLTRKDDSPTYKITFDNAFGLTPGVDLRVGGVRAGSVDDLDVERKTGRALVTVKVSEPGFSRFKSDARCAIRPQSLVGEYFMDCQPGQKGRPLPNGAQLPVEQTETTIPPDLVQNILTRPYRERFALIFNEFGSALAARGPELNETIRRAIPALNETNRTLDVLARNRAELQSLTRNSAQVLAALDARKRDVTRFVDEAGDAASASAERRTDLETTIRRFPGFLAELRPTLRDLGTVAREQGPALTDLSASADDLTTFFERLGPFAKASRPALRSLGETSVTGSKAVPAIQPIVARLRTLTQKSPELANNLAIVLEHLADRRNAVEKNPLSPGGGAGFNGLELILQYPFVQSQAINIFDDRGYILKLLILANECSQSTNAQTARNNPGRTERCSNILGPNRIGINQPDPTLEGAQASSAARRATTRRAAADEDGKRTERPGAPRSGGGESAPAPQPGGTPSATPTPGSTPAPTPGATPEALDDALDGLLPQRDVPGVPVPRDGGTPDASGLLDFLLGP